MINSEEKYQNEYHFIKNFRIACNQVIEDIIPESKKENIKVSDNILHSDIHRGIGKDNKARWRASKIYPRYFKILSC
jgi:hypothetical protein